MANAQRIAGGFPFAVYVNETATKQRIAPGLYINETIASGGSTASLASLLAFSSCVISAIAAATGLAGKLTDTSTVKAATTNTTSIAGNITDSFKMLPTATFSTSIFGKVTDTFKLQVLATYPAGISGVLKYMSALKLDKTSPAASFITALSAKTAAQLRIGLKGAPSSTFAVGIAAKTAFMSTGRGVIVFISALFATVTMQSTARAITTRVSGLQGLLRFDTRTKITGGSFPVGIAAKVAFMSKNVSAATFLVSLLAKTAMQSTLRGAVSRAALLQGIVKAASSLKLASGVFTAGMSAKTKFTAALRVLVATSGGVILTVYSAYVARSPIGMYCVRAVDKYIVHSPIGRYVARGRRNR